VPADKCSFALYEYLRQNPWITSQHAHLLSGNTGEITQTNIIIPHNRWTPGIPANELMNRWWLTGGDTDFR
jgi:hypothetical protein